MSLKIFKETTKAHRQRLGVLLLAAGCWCAWSSGYSAIPVEFADVDLGGLVNQVFNKAIQKPQQQPSSSTNLIDSGAPLEITTVGRIYPQQTQSIVIVGYGFGTQNAFNGTSAFLRIHDNTGNWDLGWTGNNDPNPVNVNVKLWNDTLILVSGLTGAYGMNGRSLNPGDKLTVSVWNPQTGKGPASTNVIVLSVSQAIQLNPSSTNSNNLNPPPSAPVAPVNFTTLHSFSAAFFPSYINSDGYWPWAGLILSGNTLYGTTGSGGSANDGTVFKVNTDGTGFTTLYSFPGGRDGANPLAGLILLGNTLYGTTDGNGFSFHSSTDGTIFAINTDGTGFRTVYNFTSTSDGSFPADGLILSGNTFYGTAYGGGSANDGTVFKVNTDGTGFMNLHNFTGRSDGGSPWAGLILSGNTLYGTTESGGGSGKGTVFRVNTDGAGFVNLHSFTGRSDGARPEAGLILLGNTLYGSASDGGNSGNGTIFAINTDGTGFTTLYSFAGGNDGGSPWAGFILSGNTLYGTTEFGGSSGKGTVFRVNPDGTGFGTIYSFDGTNGAGPLASLILSSDTLYGTAKGGDAYGNGTVFCIRGISGGNNYSHSTQNSGQSNLPAGPHNTTSNGSASIVINSITPILPQQTQTITISGSGFGTQRAFNGTSKFLKIHDDTANWDAGYNGNWINLNVSQWTDTQIAINGFTGAYGLSEWKLNAGDKLTISVWNAQSGSGPATLDATVASSASQSGGLSGAQPPLTSNINSPADAMLQKELAGAWVGEGLDDGRIVYVTFTTNDSIGLQNVQHSDQGTYSVDWSKRPYSLDVQTGDGPVDESIFEFTNSGILTEDGRGQARPTTFTDKAETLNRVNTIQSLILEGNWAAKDEDSGQTFYWTFDKNGIFTVHANGKSKVGTYLVDTSKYPPYLDINQGGDIVEMIFEASGSGLRIEGGVSAYARPHTFTPKAVIFTRANNFSSEFPSGSSVVADPFLWGDWVGEEQDSGQVLQFRFSPDGTILFQRAGGSHAGKYAVNLSQSPANLDVRWNDNSNLKVIFEITNQELHIEGDDNYTRPQQFTDRVQVLKKADPAFLSTLQGGWIGGIEASQMINLGHVDTNHILALATVLTFTSNGIIKSQGHGQSKEGTYAVDGNKDPAYLDISWENGIVDECICNLRDVSSKTKDSRVKEILMFQDGREQGRPAHFDLGVTAYNKASDDEIRQLLANQQSINNQPQTIPTNPDEK